MSKHRQALVVWIAIYPTITLIQWLFGAYLQALPLPLRTLALTGVLVPLMIYVLVPVLNAAIDHVWGTEEPHSHAPS